MRFLVLLVIPILVGLSSDNVPKNLCENVPDGFVPDNLKTTDKNGNGQNIDALCWNQKILVQDGFIGLEMFGGKTFPNVLIFRGGRDTDANCPNRAYLVDRSYIPPKVIRFGVKHACAEIDYVSSGRKNLVVALKDNVKFKYEGGKLIPPPTDVSLLEHIRFDHIYLPMAYAATPFVEELPPPK